MANLVKLETGQIIDSDLLRMSDLFGSMLEAYGNNSEYIEEVPVPSAVSSSVLDDYLNFVDKERVYPVVMQSIREASLIGDQRYLKFCVTCLLANYSKCKSVLSDLSAEQLEDVLMLIPKDLWPETWQNDNKMLARWLNKYYYSKSEKPEALHFTVDDYVYSYVFLKVSGDQNSLIRGRPNDIYVVSNVTDPVEAGKLSLRLGERDYNDEMKYNYIGYDVIEANRKAKILGEAGVGQKAFIVRDFLWVYDYAKRYEEVWSEEILNTKFFIHADRYGPIDYKQLQKDNPRLLNENRKQYHKRINMLIDGRHGEDYDDYSIDENRKFGHKYNIDMYKYTGGSWYEKERRGR